MTTAIPATERPHDGLTSFGFLQDVDEQHESPFALNAIFNRVKSALGAAPSEDACSSAPIASTSARTLDSLSLLAPGPRQASSSSSSGGGGGGGVAPSRVFSDARQVARGLPPLDELSEMGAPSLHHRLSPPTRTGTSETARKASTSTSHSYLAGSGGKTSPHRAQAAEVASAISASSQSVLSSAKPSSSTRAGGGAARGLPVPLRTIAPAPTMTSISPALAVTHRLNAGAYAASSVDDQDSIAADDGEQDGDASRDQLGDLRSRAIDRSHLAAHGWSAIPGFPLSKDILADDARSVHSSSSRLPRSDTIEEIHYSATPSRSGFQTSADAIIRRLRGEGLSRRFWMADENAKECRECLTVFTPFRRKHHCRICGQIFCGRCASHIIKGNRFGYDGLIRVCNFCMRMLEDYDRHGPGAHQSSVVESSSLSSSLHASRAARAFNPALRDKQLISAPLEAQVQSPQSQFAANNLFATAITAPAVFAFGSDRLERRNSIDAIALESGSVSADASPKQPASHAEPDGVMGASTSVAAAPFRKVLADDEMTVAPVADEMDPAIAGQLPNEPTTAISPAATAQAGSDRAVTDGRVAFPTSESMAGLGVEDGALQSMHLPGASSAHASNEPTRLRLVSDAAARRPSYRTRLKSRNAMLVEASHANRGDLKLAASSPLLANGGGGGGEDKESGSVDGTTTVESDPGKEFRICTPCHITPALLASSVSLPALHHLKTMLEQTLAREQVPRVKVWLDVLLPIVLTAVSKVRPNPRESSRMDVRQVIKIKRIPGGKASECEYVHGFVCSKNVATKRMAKSLPLTNARVMVVRFPLDYHRGPNQFMSLEPLMAQEHEFIRILVARVVALRPQIVVVEKTVSRLALDLLERAGVVVVWSLKPSAIEAISRCTQADIITSIDRLALEPKLGRCHSFSVVTFEHSSFPEMRKSFMRFEGTPKDLGCTIVLRGANGAMLSKIKRILELMIFVAYNLRLEEHVLQDEGADIETVHPASSNGGELGSTPISHDKDLYDPAALQPSPSAGTLTVADDPGDTDAETGAILAATRRIDGVLKIYRDTLLSCSACIRLPAPYPIIRLKQENELLLQLKRRNEAEELERILKDEGKLSEVANGVAASVEEPPTPAVAPPAIASVEEGDVTPTSKQATIDAETAMPPVAPGSTTQDTQAERKKPDAAGESKDSQGSSEASEDIETDEVETPKAVPTDLSEHNDNTIAKSSSADPSPASLLRGILSSESAPTTPSASSATRPSFPAGSLSELPTRTSSPAPTPSVLSSVPSNSSRSTLVPGIGSSKAMPGFSSDLVASLRAPSEVAREFEYGIVKERHAALLRRWARHLEVPSSGLSPLDHQRLCMLTNTMCAVTQKPCEEARLMTIDFYGSGDETLGHHLEELARNSSKACPVKNCGRQNVVHYRGYVNGGVRIQVLLERFVCPIPGEENRLLSWSYCKVCENATPVAIVTPESWSFSFAKYLELYFYRNDGSKTKLCNHDFYRDQVRYFAFQNLAIRFHWEELELYEVAVPSTKLFISPATQSNLKNEESVTFSRKSSAYWDSVMARIKALSADACSDASTGPNRDRNRLLLSERIKRCEADRREIENCIVRTYRDSSPTDVLCLNRVQRALQEKVVKWDLDFIEFEKSLIPTEKDIRRITTNHLKRIFAEKDSSEKGSESASIGGRMLPPAAEIDESAVEAASESASEKLPPTDDAGLERGSQTGTVTDAGDKLTIDTSRSAGSEPAAGDLLVSDSGANTDAPSASGSTSAPISPVETHARPLRRPQADDDTTDAADLSPVEVRHRGERAAVPATAMTAPASPVLSSSQPRNAFYPGFSRADESSCTENELARSVSNLVRRFDGSRRPAPVHANSSSGAPASRVGGEIRRPGMRRGKTEEMLSSQARSGSSKAAAGRSSTYNSGVQGADKPEEGVRSRAVSPLRRPSGQASQSRVPRIKRGDSATSVASSSKRSGETTPTNPPPPSSFRPPKGEGLKAGPRPIIGRSGAVNAARYRGSDSDKPGLPAGRQDASGSAQGKEQYSYFTGAGGGASTSSSRVPVPRRGENGPGTRSRVSTIAKHFDRISREAERERERQQRLLVAQRARRARPVAMTRAKVEVFSSIKEAVRDDESDRDTAESGDDGAFAADNEDEGDDDFDNDDADVDAAASRERERGLGSASSSFNRRRGNGKSLDVRSGVVAPFSSSSSPVPVVDGSVTPGADSTSREATLKGSAAASSAKQLARRDASEATIVPAPHGSPDAGSTSASTSVVGAGGGGEDWANSAQDNIVARRQLGKSAAAAAARRQAAAGSELESDAPSVTASSLTGSTISSTLPSYLRNGMLTDSDSNMTLEKSFLKTLSGFWAVRTGEMVPLEYPMLNSEHVFGDSEVIFREDEPSSILAFTLSSRQYNDRLRTLQAEGTKIKEADVAFMPDVDGEAEADGWGMIDVEGAALESVLKKEGTHFRCEFESGSTRLWCKILFAEQFDALRRSCSCDYSFIESLSRCVKWDSSGGKSGSAFLKTRDDRLVVKQLSRFEMDAFSKFAPQYFAYMSQCFGQGRRTTLAKIFGCFRIGFRNPQTGKSLKMDCLVMENLFYDRELTRIFDLKGSMRNRHIQETGRANEVLLDENLVEMAHSSPLFVREHSKRLLRSALYNDSLFLADMNVMDYSLVVGLDRKRQELVVGIIDFVRTYTWDKRVESFVKETALLGGAGKGEPTIITPRQYRTRFLTFLDRSFLLMPDCWLSPGWTQ